MVKVGHLEFSEAPWCLLNVTRAEVLLEQENYLFDQVLDGAQAPAHSPNIVESDQAMLHIQQGVGAAKGLTYKRENKILLQE